MKSTTPRTFENWLIITLILWYCIIFSCQILYPLLDFGILFLICHQGGNASTKMHKILTQWTQWLLKSPVSRLFTQPFIQAQIKENIKAPCHWPLCGDFTGDRWIPRTTGSNAENVSIWWRHNDCLTSKEIPIITIRLSFSLPEGLSFHGRCIETCPSLSCRNHVQCWELMNDVDYCIGALNKFIWCFSITVTS